MELVNSGQEKSMLDEIQQKQVSRRRFMRYAGIAGASAVVIGSTTLAGCSKDDNNGVNLGSGDIGVLNYAYALEQLEAAFYIQVMTTPFTGITATETSYLTDIRDHEIAHRELFKAALSTNAIQGLEVNFSAVNFSSRDSVLATAKTFEDLGVAAYNGAGKLLVSTDYLTLAGKIVSVEARHAATLRDLISNGTFADLSSLSAFGSSNTNALDGALTPPAVLAIASAYIKTKINASNLPTS